MRKMGDMDRVGAPRLPRKPEAPESLKEAVGRAKARTIKRDTALPLGLERDKAGDLITDDKGEPVWAWPFDGDTPGDWPEWSWMLVDAFGTRNSAVAQTFLDQLLDLCSSEWDAKIEQWVPDDGEMQLMLAVVRSHRPKDEAQAALAAQVAATHIITMRVGKRVAQSPHDTRMISAYARLLQASAALSEVARPSRKRAARQSIKVVRETHVHHHQHLHRAGDGQETRSRGHTNDGLQKPTEAARTGRAALSCQDKGGDVVSLAVRQK